MLIPICPKCHKQMTLYMFYQDEQLIVGWQCPYDNFDTLMGYKVSITDYIETIKYQMERSTNEN